MTNQVKHYAEMIENLNETFKKNLEAVRDAAKTRVENTEQIVARTADTQFSFFVSTLNQLTNNYLNYFASSMNNINAGWHNLNREREQVKNICLSSIDSAYENFVKRMPRTIIDETKTGEAAETRNETKADAKTETARTVKK